MDLSAGLWHGLRLVGGTYVVLDTSSACWVYARIDANGLQQKTLSWGLLSSEAAFLKMSFDELQKAIRWVGV